MSPLPPESGVGSVRRSPWCATGPPERDRDKRSRLPRPTRQNSGLFSCGGGSGARAAGQAIMAGSLQISRITAVPSQRPCDVQPEQSASGPAHAVFPGSREKSGRPRLGTHQLPPVDVLAQNTHNSRHVYMWHNNTANQVHELINHSD